MKMKRAWKLWLRALGGTHNRSSSIQGDGNIKKQHLLPKGQNFVQKAMFLSKAGTSSLASLDKITGKCGVKKQNTIGFLKVPIGTNGYQV